MIKISFVSQSMGCLGGGAKDISLLFQYIDRKLFDPRILAGGNMAPFAEEFGIPEDRWSWCDLKDVSALSQHLAGTDVVVYLSGTGNDISDYTPVWQAANQVKAKLRVMRIVFGLGTPLPSAADLFLSSSMDAHITGIPVPGCHVLYPPLPLHAPPIPRPIFRHMHDISEDAFVVGYACADHRDEFYEVARLLSSHENFYFLSAISPKEGSEIPRNMRFCNILRQSEMPSLYGASDMIVHARTESFGYSIYQALQAKVPVAALWTTSRNAFAEAMYPDGGYIARNVDGLAHAVLHVNRYPHDAMARAEMAYQRISLLRPEPAARRLGYLIIQALHEKGLHAPWSGEVPTDYPGPHDITRWKLNRIEIEQMLYQRLFV